MAKQEARSKPVLSKKEAEVRKKELTKARNKALDNETNELEEIEKVQTGAITQQAETDILKQLFSIDNIKTKTDLSSEHIDTLTRLYFLAGFIDFPELKEVCDTFVTLRVSHKRMGRKEFVDAIKGFDLNESKKSGLLGGLFKNG